MSKEKKLEPTKQKKNHQKLKFFLAFLCLAAIALGYIVYTGAWNPFKSKEPDPQAIQNYENAYELPSQMWNEMNPDYAQMDKDTIEYQEFDHDFGPNSDCPYGFEILEDNGKEGKNGVLKAMSTSSGSYTEKYGVTYEVYFMLNEDYANEKYIGFTNGDSGVNDFRKEYTTSNAKITIAKRNEDSFALLYVKFGTTLYYMAGDTHDYQKMQALFNRIGIDFQVPNLVNLK